MPTRRLDVENPLSEYPNPQFRRESFLCLNGKWDFEITDKIGSPNFYTKTIIVPFAVESSLSWIKERIKEGDVLHYRKIFSVPNGFIKDRVFLHFEAVDQVCDIYLNGWKVGHHEGGYEPFSIEVTNLAQEKNVLQVNVIDDTNSPFYPKGKQSSKPKGIFYTPTTGIWLPVWIESTKKEYIKDIKIIDSFDEKLVSIKIDFEGKFTFGDITLLKNGKSYKKIPLDKGLYGRINLFGDFHPWSPSDPYLYDFKININGDEVYSYFAIRKFSTIEIGGNKYFALNNKPLFLAGVLDQGYWKDGGLTPPSDQALINDIQFAKDCGFNFIRKHIKVESRRWYYHCDRLGMLVMQDMVNMAGSFSKFLFYTAPFINYKFVDTAKSFRAKVGSGLNQTRQNFAINAKATVTSLKNVPCIFAWTIFNEGWGQFNSKEMHNYIRKFDDSRLIDVNSGWFDQGIGDFNSKHIYFKKLKLTNDKNRILFLSEFGGYSYKEIDHGWKKRFGYKFFRNREQFENGMKKLFKEDLLESAKKSGLGGYVYTQLSDVEGELNGLLTFDRQVQKIDIDLMKHLNMSFELDDKKYE